MSVIATWVLWTASALGGATPLPALLTPREDWNRDFTDRVAATAACPGGSLEHLRSTLRVRGPLQSEQLERPLPPELHARLRTGDGLYAFEGYFVDTGRRPWGFAGHVVVRDDCIVHADVTGYDN